MKYLAALRGEVRGHIKLIEAIAVEAIAKGSGCGQPS